MKNSEAFLHHTDPSRPEDTPSVEVISNPILRGVGRLTLGVGTIYRIGLENRVTNLESAASREYMKLDQAGKAELPPNDPLTGEPVPIQRAMMTTGEKRVQRRNSVRKHRNARRAAVMANRHIVADIVQKPESKMGEDGYDDSVDHYLRRSLYAANNDLQKIRSGKKEGSVEDLELKIRSLEVQLEGKQAHAKTTVKEVGSPEYKSTNAASELGEYKGVARHAERSLAWHGLIHGYRAGRMESFTNKMKQGDSDVVKAEKKVKKIDSTKEKVATRAARLEQKLGTLERRVK